MSSGKIFRLRVQFTTDELNEKSRAAILRLGACLGVPVDLIEPLGFLWDDARVRRTAMDYIDHVAITRLGYAHQHGYQDQYAAIPLHARHPLKGVAQ